MTETERQRVESLLFIIFEKTKYDEGFYIDRDGEEEALFLDYRLKIINNFSLNKLLTCRNSISGNNFESYLTTLPFLIENWF